MTADTSLTDLVAQAQQLADAGRAHDAAGLYRGWLDAGPQPLAFAARFNLAVLLDSMGDAAAAEQEYRAATALHPAFAQAWLGLAELLVRSGRAEEALNCWSIVPGVTEESAHHVAALNRMAQTLDALGRVAQGIAMYRRSLAREPAQPEVLQELLHVQRNAYATGSAGSRGPARPDDAAQPLVSILIPTHNRPDYAELALLSALGQSYPNVEIVISDNSDDELTLQRFAPYVAAEPCIRYLRAPGLPALDNFHNCTAHAQGELVNFLMDDDLFHPEKIERMAVHLRHPNVGLVTSFRQQIDAEGRGIAPTSPSTARLMETAGAIGGAAMFRHVLLTGLNVIGEPTTVLCRKALLGAAFGSYLGRQYRIVPDMAAWLGILRTHDCVYLPEPLSYFRMHGNQDQSNPVTQVRGAIENLRLLCDSCRHAGEPLAQDNWKSVLSGRLAYVVGQLPQWEPLLAQGTVRADDVQALVGDVLGLLLPAPA